MPFQARLYQTDRLLEVTADPTWMFRGVEITYAGALLQAVSQQVGIPVESLKLAFDLDGNGFGSVINAVKYIITNDCLYWVIVEKDALMRYQQVQTSNRGM